MTACLDCSSTMEEARSCLRERGHGGPCCNGNWYWLGLTASASSETPPLADTRSPAKDGTEPE